MPNCQYKYLRNRKFCKLQSCEETGNEECFKPYPPRMTDKEYAEQQKEVLKDLPEEFHGALSYMAWEQGHSSGYEEVLGYLRDLVANLQEPIKKFEARIKK